MWRRRVDGRHKAGHDEFTDADRDPQLDADLRTGEQERLGQKFPRCLIKPREKYFGLLVSGYSTEQIASLRRRARRRFRRAVGQALAKRQLDAPVDYARLQVARLTKALRCADVSLEEGDLKAIASFLKVVRELNLYQGVRCRPDAARPACGAAEIAPTAPPLTLTHSPGRGGRGIVRGRKKLRESAAKFLQSFARVNLCAGVLSFFGSAKSRHFRLDLTGDWLSAPYWVRWPGAAAKLNRLARSCPMFASFASSMNRPGEAQACRSVPILDWYGSTWLTYQLLAGTAR